MSKSVKLVLSFDNRPDLLEVFGLYMDSLSKSVQVNHYGYNDDGWLNFDDIGLDDRYEDLYGDDDGFSVSTGVRIKHPKRGKGSTFKHRTSGRNGKRGKLIMKDMFDDEIYGNVPYVVEDNLDDDDTNAFMIYYYPNFEDSDYSMLFRSLREFDDYCEHHGLKVNPDVANDIVYSDVYHCCSVEDIENPGHFNLLGSDTYNGLLKKFMYCVKHEE